MECCGAAYSSLSCENRDLHLFRVFCRQTSTKKKMFRSWRMWRRFFSERGCGGVFCTDRGGVMIYIFAVFSSSSALRMMRVYLSFLFFMYVAGGG